MCVHANVMRTHTHTYTHAMRICVHMQKELTGRNVDIPTHNISWQCFVP